MAVLRARCATILAACLASACAGTGCRRTTGSTDAATDSAASASSASSSPDGSPAASAERAGLGPTVDARAWFAERGVPSGRLLDWYRTQMKSCRPELVEASLDVLHHRMRVGAPEVDALYGEHLDACELATTHAYLVTVRSGAPIILLDVPLEIWSYDEGTHFLDLTLVVAPDGRSATLTDRAPIDCTAALTRARETRASATPTSKSWAEPFARALEQSCAKRGTWTWKDGRFFRPT